MYAHRPFCLHITTKCICKMSVLIVKMNIVVGFNRNEIIN